MKLTKLSLANYRGFEQLDVDFEPDITVIAGVNGVGKSSVLNALAVLMSRTLPEFTPCRAKSLYFSDDQIHDDRASLEVSLQLTVGEQSLSAGIQRVRNGEDESDRFLVLNLNHPQLVANRKATLDAFCRAIGGQNRNNGWFNRKFSEWRGDGGGELQPFSQVVVYYLCRRLGVAL